MTSEDENDITFDDDQQRDWVKNNLKSRKCNRFTCEESSDSPSDDDDPKCQCGKKKSNHEVSHLDNPRPENKWQVETHTEEIHVDAFGEMKFSHEKYYPTKFIRVDIFTEPEVLWKLLTECWNLPPPKFVMTVTGGTPDWQWNALSRRVLQNGLKKAAESTDAWIFTEGRQSGVANVVGDAVPGYIENVKVIGLTTWGSFNQKMPNESLQRQDLGPGHFHFLMFDDGTTGVDGIENLVWGKIVQKICEKRLHEERTEAQIDVTIPSVCLTANGTTTTLATVYEHIIHGTPCLVIENTGTMADILTYAVKHAKPVQVDKDKNQTYSNKNTSKSVRYLSNEALSHISRQIEKNFGTADLEVSLERIKVCVRDPRLIGTYRMDGMSESEEGLLNAVMNLICSSVIEHTHSQIENQLKLAITWNTVEVARSTIVAGTTDWSEEVLPNCFQHAIKQDAFEFVDLFIDNGAVLKKAKLEELYKEEGDRLPPTLLKMKRKNKGQLGLDEVNQFIETTMDLPNIEKANTTDRQDVAKEFWKHLDEPIMDALVACKILQKMKLHETDTRKKSRMEEHVKKHKERAIAVLDEHYDAKFPTNLQLMGRKSCRWGNSTCMEMAFTVNSRRFLAHPVAQLELNKKWRGISTENEFELPSTDKECDCRTQYRKWKKFCSAPAVKFQLNVIMQLIFLLLFSYIILTDFRQDISWQECVLIGWVATIFLEELRQCLQDRKKGWFYSVKNYFAMNWNIMDTAAVSMFTLGAMLRNFPKTFDTARIILTLNLGVFYLGFLKTFYMNRILGPKLVIIYRMIQDMLFFMCVFIVFVTGYGVTYFAIMFPNESDPRTIFSGIFSTSYLQVFGHNLVDHIEVEDCSDNVTLIEMGLAERCPQYTWIGRILLYIYIMLSTVLLLNLLIAMLSNTYSNLQESKDEAWIYHKYTVEVEYIQRPLLPPPFNILVHITRFVKAAIWGMMHRHDYSNDVEGYHRVNKGEGMFPSIFSNLYARNYLQKREMKVSDTVEVEIDGVFKKFNFRRSCQMDGRVKLHTSIVREHNLLAVKGLVEQIIEAKEFDDADDKDDYVENEIHDKVHYHSRSSPYLGTNERRFPVPRERIDWKTPFRGYDPIAFTHKSILNGLPEEVDPELLLIENEGLPKIKFNEVDEHYNCIRKSFPVDYKLDEKGLPRNPRGRTGLVGRGTLKRFGPNHRIDCVLTRWKKSSLTSDIEEKNGKQVLQFLAIKKTRKDMTWSLPTIRAKDKYKRRLYNKTSFLLVGDDLSEKVTEDLLSELDITDQERGTIRKEFDNFLCTHQYREVYKGYVDDARNTDNAWVEVEARNYHDADNFLFREWDPELEERLFKVPVMKWMDVESSDNMRYTRYRDLLRMTAEIHNFTPIIATV